ncbi:HAD family hydrolase [Escherichia coli]|jgi:mannitol-1-/sugar-/sorbitol-6-/2-deoxyglucose-6-phosphatase|uniref:HAD-IA family hydrolase n=1 Tax=Escherichia coli TaxID=562 RepID=A0A085P933_ECOLX|nr:HAD-IA family hydrolase [Escherichia coli]MCF0257476.1 HAD-IA family hydrolase [Bacteroides heparinolyticus]MCI7297831.1 HAD-IA family hydrolase [Shigella dysenteriae]HDQ6730034.1 HAD-IA family hydrolase [Escherichia coli O11:H5]EES0673085.1 HAD-IA family hydrolase [Escherichia coli]EEU3605116.1 HAD-IA family hydrolase [Escherichia coli]
MFSAVIFDMDGVLVDSEPVWREVECEYYLRNYGLSLQREDFDPFTGMPVTIFLRKLHQRHALPEDNLRQVHDTIVEEVARRIRLKPAPLPGVYELLNHLHQHNIPLAVASSSPQRQIDNVLSTLNMRHYFSAVISAEGLAHGKPHPEIFLTAALMTGQEPEFCLVIEDSLNGVVAAKAAGMHVIALPAEHQQDDPRFTLADGKVTSHWQILERFCE